MSGFLTDKDGPYIYSDPADVRDYQIDWSNILEPGETIVSSSWAVPVGLSAGFFSYTSSTTTQKIGGGKLSTVHRIDNTISTSRGRTYKRGFRLMVKTNL